MLLLLKRQRFFLRFFLPVVLAVLVVAMLNGPGNPRQIGDRLQIALPSIAFACSGCTAWRVST